MSTYDNNYDYQSQVFEVFVLVVDVVLVVLVGCEGGVIY